MTVARLLRPHIPMAVRVRVAQRQLCDLVHGGGYPGVYIAPLTRFKNESETAFLGRLLVSLRHYIKVDEDEPLHLDHTPALENRVKVFRDGKHVDYDPPANDPEHLLYRGKASHQIKTNVRGDGAQYSDRALAKRERNRQRTEKTTRPLRSANRWPPRGSRKIQNRRNP